MTKQLRATHGKVRLTILSTEREMNTKGESPIYVVYSLREKRYRYYTGKRVKKRYWDFKNERIKPQVEGATLDNEFLVKIKRQLTTIIDNAITKVPRINPTTEYIKSEIQKCNLPITGKSVLEYFNEWIESNKSKDSPSTITGYYATYKRFESFVNETNYLFTFENINIVFYDKFIAHYRKQLTPKGENYSENTIGKWIKIFKRFLKWSESRGYNLYNEYKDFKVIDSVNDFEFLTNEEYKKLCDLDLSLYPHYDKVRDIFCVGCETSFRFSDLMNLKWENIFKNEKVIRIVPIKTGKKDSKQQIVPLLETTQLIFDKYKNLSQPLPKITNQKANLYIKDILQMAKVNTACNVVKYKGNQRIEKTVPKYELIKMHTARKIYIIHCLESEIGRDTVMSLSNHKNDAVFKRYVQITTPQKQKEIKKLVEMRNK